MRSILFTFAALFILGCTSVPQEDEGRSFDSSRDTVAIWDAIEARHYSWRDADYETHMNTIHLDWQRWSRTKDQLLTKEDYTGFWDYLKERERCIEMKLDPIAVEVLGDGQAVLVHYVSTETWEWIAPDSEDGKEQGAIYQSTLRWSDVLVREDDQWLCIGGYRDRSSSEKETIRLNE